MERSDLDALVGLHRRAFGVAAGESDHRLASRLESLFFAHPWPDQRLPSLLYEEDDGEIVGCLGVMPRPMLLDGRPLLAAVSHDFMVAPDRRSTMAALELLRAFLAGPQELSIAEGNEASRRLWTAMGGTTALAYSFRWTRLLRPARFALSRWSRRGLPGPLAMMLRPFGAAMDLATSRVAGSPFRRARPGADIVAEPLSTAALADGIDRFSKRRSLRPRYDPSALERVLAMAETCSDQGPLRGVLLRRHGNVAGWYLYFPERPGIASVLQLVAAEDSALDVLDHLCEDARARGACALGGQVDPFLLPALADRACLVHRGTADRWLLVHGRNERALRALHLGHAFHSHLEGEFWL